MRAGIQAPQCPAQISRSARALAPPVTMLVISSVQMSRIYPAFVSFLSISGSMSTSNVKLTAQNTQPMMYGGQACPGNSSSLLQK